MNNAKERLFNGLIKENPTFVLTLGMCPTLAVTTSAINGAGMGLSTTVVLILSNVFISLLRKVIPGKVRIPAFIVVIASFVTIVQLLLQGYVPSLYESLGIYIPLIVVNCIILGRAEAYAYDHPVLPSLFDGLGMGLGFTAALTIIGMVRELLGAGQIFGLQILGPDNVFFHVGILKPFAMFLAGYVNINIFIMAPGAFFVLAFIIALMNRVKRQAALKGKPLAVGKEAELSCGMDCANCADSGCNHRFYDPDAKDPVSTVSDAAVNKGKEVTVQAAVVSNTVSVQSVSESDTASAQPVSVNDTVSAQTSGASHTASAQPVSVNNTVSTQSVSESNTVSAQSVSEGDTASTQPVSEKKAARTPFSLGKFSFGKAKAARRKPLADDDLEIISLDDMLDELPDAIPEAEQVAVQELVVSDIIPESQVNVIPVVTEREPIILEPEDNVRSSGTQPKVKVEVKDKPKAVLKAKRKAEPAEKLKEEPESGAGAAKPKRTRTVKSETAEKAKTVSKSGAAGKAKTAAKSETTDKAKAGAKSEAAGKVKTTAESEAAGKAKTTAKSKTTGKAKTAAKSEAEDKPKTTTKRGATSRAKTATKSEVTEKAKTTAQSEAAEKKKTSGTTKTGTTRSVTRRKPKVEEAESAAETEAKIKAESAAETEVKAEAEEAVSLTGKEE